MTSFLAKVVLPVACIALSAWLIYDGQLQVATAQSNYEAARAKLAEGEEANLALDRLGSSKPILSVPESPTEEMVFLTGIRTHATKNGATVLKMSSTTERYQKGVPPQDQSLIGLTRITCHVTAQGSYASLQKFLDSLSSSRRLYVFSNLRWARQGAGNQLSVSITRYVRPSSELPSQ